MWEGSASCTHWHVPCRRLLFNQSLLVTCLRSAFGVLTAGQQRMAPGGRAIAGLHRGTVREFYCEGPRGIFSSPEVVDVCVCGVRHALAHSAAFLRNHEHMLIRADASLLVPPRTLHGPDVRDTVHVVTRRRRDAGAFTGCAAAVVKKPVSSTERVNSTAFLCSLERSISFACLGMSTSTDGGHIGRHRGSVCVLTAPAGSRVFRDHTTAPTDRRRSGKMMEER